MTRTNYSITLDEESKQIWECISRQSEKSFSKWIQNKLRETNPPSSELNYWRNRLDQLTKEKEEYLKNIEISINEAKKKIEIGEKYFNKEIDKKIQLEKGETDGS